MLNDCPAISSNQLVVSHVVLFQSNLAEKRRGRDLGNEAAKQLQWRQRADITRPTGTTVRRENLASVLRFATSNQSPLYCFMCRMSATYPQRRLLTRHHRPLALFSTWVLTKWRKLTSRVSCARSNTPRVCPDHAALEPSPVGFSPSWFDWLHIGKQDGMCG